MNRYFLFMLWINHYKLQKLQYEKANKGFQKQIKFFHWGDVEKNKRISNEKDKEIKDFRQSKFIFDKWKQIHIDQDFPLFDLIMTKYHKTFYRWETQKMFLKNIFEKKRFSSFSIQFYFRISFLYETVF